MAPHARRLAPMRHARTIRWDRVGRVALLGTLAVIMLLYVSPARHWIEQSRTAGEQNAELRDLAEQEPPAQAARARPEDARRARARGPAARDGAPGRARLRDREPARR